VDRPVITHRFGTLDAKQEQRYSVGMGPRKFQFKRAVIRKTEVDQLRAFWESMQGPWQAFTYNVPNPNNTTTAVLVTFEQAPLSFEYLVNAARTGLNLIEVVDPTAAPSYTVASTCVRFPSTALSAALLSEVQQIIPLMHIRVRESAVADIYLADRRVTVGGQLYLPRLTGIGEPGSDVLISQDIKGTSDNVRFTFGNGDRVMTQLANDTDLKYAEIDLCLYHVNSGILLQLWKGVIQNFASDGTAVFPVTCSDGFFQIMNQYPERQISRQCWKTFNDGVNCPYAAHGSGGSATSCDYYLTSTNGCQAHGMSLYFGGQQADPQGVSIKDDSTGFLGFCRNAVTATSIISETVWGLALQEIWCNSGGNPLFAFMATPLMVDYRDESTFADSLGIIGAGPLGGFTASMVVQNADGYRYVVCPMVDGFTWQGFQVDGNLNITKYQPNMGLRLAPGSDPASPSLGYFSLGQGSPQVWEPYNYAAGVALCEMRIVKPSAVQPSTPDQHKMTVPVDYGLWGWVWDASGNRTAVMGLVNPFWIAVNMLLRAMGLYGNPSTGTGPSSATQLAAFVAASLVKGDGSGAAEIAADQVTPLFGASSTSGYEITTLGETLNGSQINLNPDGSYSFQYQDGSGNLNVLSIDDALNAGYVATTTTAITEPQFQFQGVISSQKPFRDWLSEVLNCCLGFYTWEFGKLKLGCRVNAGAVDAYTLGNTLFQSLRLTPITAAYEHEVLSYADVAYQYQANTAEYCDKSHAAYYGRAGSPLTTQKHSAGCSTLSQGLRLSATHVREEVGGVTPAEWRDARAASWYTTLLGLGNEVGQVVSMTHPDVPGVHGTCNVSGNTATWVSGDAWTYAGSTAGDTELIDKVVVIGGSPVTITAVASDGSTITTSPAPPSGTGLAFQVITMCFRVQRWSLKKDWSVQIEGQTVTASMYDLDVGPKPIDVTPAGLPALFYPIPLGPVWAPYQVQAASNDALFPGEWTFDSDQEYNVLADGSALANLTITGKLPVNEFSATGAGAPGIGSITQGATGGSLPANTTLRVAICAIDANGVPSAPSNIVIVGTGPAAGGSITLNGITWPAVTGLASYVLFVGTQDDLICAQATGTLTAGSGGTVYTPGSITFGAAVARSTWALPSPYVGKVRVKAKLLAHSGVAGLSVDNVSTNTLLCLWMIDTSSTPFNPVGRVLSMIGSPDRSTPFASFNITGCDHATGTLTLDRDPTGIVLVGDAVVIRNKADAPNSGNPTQITDSGYKNSTDSYGGLTPGAEVGNLIRVIRGTGRGQPPSQITANTATTLTFQPGIVMDETSVWIIEAPVWAFQADSTSIDNASPLTPVVLSVPAANFIKQPVLIAGFTVDVNGLESPDGDGPIREDWIYGAAGSNATPGVTLQVDGTLAIGSNQAPIVALSASRAAQSVAVYLKTGPTGAGAIFNINLGGALWMTLTVAAGNTTVQATAAQLAAAGPLTASANITLDITAVGTTVPGSDLSIFIYL
jgi:hypothetical protein